MKRTQPTVLESLQRDLAILDATRPRMLRAGKLYKRLQDTEMALGSDLMGASLEGYSFLKAGGKGKGLDEMRKMLGVRFLRGNGPRPDPTA